MGGKFYRALVYRCFTSNFLFINGYGFSPSSTLSTATTITSTTFQCRKPTIFRHPSSHGWSAFFKSSKCIQIHVFRSSMNWTPIHLILWKPRAQGNCSLLGSLFGFLGWFRLSRFLNFTRIFLNFPSLLLFGFDMIFTLDVLLLFTGWCSAVVYCIYLFSMLFNYSFVWLTEKWRKLWFFSV